MSPNWIEARPNTTRRSAKKWTSVVSPNGTMTLGILVCSMFGSALAHGRLTEPPSRSTMWRYGFNTTPNYNDHELFCGGLSRMVRNAGKCGLCGDPADAPSPRDNEAGGKYSKGIVVRRYEVNQIVDVEVEITAYHKGYVQFKVCPTNNPNSNPTEQCFDDHILRLADGNKDTDDGKYFLPPPQPGGKFKLRYSLPKWLECSQCVLQWTYVAGNNWGQCADGTGAIGCGHQETFRACADIAIGDHHGHDIETNEIPNDSSKSFISSTLLFILLSTLVFATLKDF